jgi:DNA-binding MarR family transcriptional regulator
MFDVNVSETEIYRESAGYRPGTAAVLADAGFAKIGMTVCYDLRFAHLFRHLAQAGAQILMVPAAFNHITGAAHWEVLLRARAIETGCFVLAPAQTGFHAETGGKGRRTFGHSLAIAPWGEVLADAGTEPGVTLVDLDLSQVATARAFHVTRGAMTNTLTKLEWAGHVHIRPDWDDARQKFVAISPAGRAARDAAVAAVIPMIADVVQSLGPDKVRAVLPILREMRVKLEGES